VNTVAASISQHASQASFLWEIRRLAVCAPHYRLADLAKLDLRLDAHLDGLRIANEGGWQSCRDELRRWCGPGEVFAAAVLAFEADNLDRIREVAEIATVESDATPGLISALGWLPFAEAESHIERLASGSAPALLHVALAASAIHRRDPRDLLRRALFADEPLLLARALKSVGELGRTDLIFHAAENVISDHPEVRFRAAWSLALLGAHEKSLQTLQAIAMSDHPRREKAIQLAVRTMPCEAARDWQHSLAQQDSHLRAACRVSSALGDPESAPWLIEQMKVPFLSRVAGEAFTMITGIEISLHDLEGPRPEGFKSGPNEDPTDENVELDADENLPWPDTEKIASWWRRHEAEFTPGVRYLLGKPITVEWLNRVLRKGYQRQRAAAALELAIRQPGTPLFEVRAPGFRQQEWLR
jgi:uncharacterized protein (TIGR02270 family)